MTNKLNGTAKWIIVTIAVLTIGFNTGITYNHIHSLTQKIEKLVLVVDKLDEKIDAINIRLAAK